MEILTTRAQLRELAEQLACEYAGAVAPGYVMRLVASTALRLNRSGCSRDLLLPITRTTVHAKLVALVGGELSMRRLA